MDGKDMVASSKWSGAQSGIIEPMMVRIPEGWFGMGCETGRDDEKPVQRVWVDALERAARGGAEGLLYPWGDAPPEMVPDYDKRWKLGPEPVGLYAANAYGLYNLGDNVHEWCADWYDDGYYGRSPERNPLGPKSGSRRASRGGSWRHHIKVTRTAARSSIPPEFQYADYGFRIARSSTA